MHIKKLSLCAIVALFRTTDCLGAEKYAYSKNRFEIRGYPGPDQADRYAEVKQDAPARLIPLTWGEYLDGIGAAAADGATVGLSSFIPVFRDARDKLFKKNPGTAYTANIAGLMPDLFVALPGRLLIKGAQEGIEAVIKYGPHALIDRGAALIVSKIPLLNKSISVVPIAASSVVKGGLVTASNIKPGDSDPVSTVETGSLVSGTIGGVLAGGAKYAFPTIGSMLGMAGLMKDNAIGQVLKASGISSQDFINRLLELPGNTRVYDIDPAVLGFGGILGYIGRVYPKLNLVIRNTATQDIADIGAASQGLTERYLGPTLPKSYDNYLADVKNARSQATAPLYEAANKTRVDLAAHPDLLNHYVIGSGFANYLNKALGDRSDRTKIININRFLANRNSLVAAGDKVLESTRNIPIGNVDLNNIYSNTVTNHISDNNLDLSVPLRLIDGYIYDIAANRATYTQQFYNLPSNLVNYATRIADMTSRAIQEVSPEYTAAQQAFRQLSIPVDQAVLARSLTQMGEKDSSGAVTRLDSEVTDDFIRRHNNLVQRAAEAGLPDNSRPLTHYILDAVIDDRVLRNTQEYPQAILDTITNQVQPRLEAVFGQEPVSNLIRDAANNVQLLDNRVSLAKLGATRASDTRKLVYVVDFLHSNPETAANAIKEYLVKISSGNLFGFNKWITVLVPTAFGKAIAHDVYTGSPTLITPPSKNGPSLRVARKKFLTRYSLEGRAKDVYDRLYRVQPKLADDIINAANHQIPVDDILKNWENPSDRSAIGLALYTINPNYKSEIAKNVQEFNRNLQDPESPARLKLFSYQRLALLIVFQMENFKNLRSAGFPGVNGVFYKVERFVGNSAIAKYDRGVYLIRKEIERGESQGWPIVLAPLYDVSLGPVLLGYLYNNSLNDVDKKIYKQIYNAASATGGYGGYKAYDLWQETLTRLQSKGYIRVEPDGMITPLKGQI